MVTDRIDCKGLSETRADRVLAHRWALQATEALNAHRGRFHWRHGGCMLGINAIVYRASEPTTVTDDSLDDAFERTFELDCHDHYSVSLPPLNAWLSDYLAQRGACTTDGLQWYDTRTTCVRGVFHSLAQARQWAHDAIPGLPYTVLFYQLDDAGEWQATVVEAS